MRKPNFAWDNRWCRTPLVACCWFLSSCATPEYAIRSPTSPEESAATLHIERTISAYQAQEFEQQGARLLGWDEQRYGFSVSRLVDRLSRVTERATLHYRAFLYDDRDPNAAALADGRIYLSTGMLRYLASRGSREEELAVVIAHELAHTVAQHLVKRYRLLQQQQLLMSLLAAGAAAATRDAGTGAQQAGRLALNVATLLRDVANSGYSQEQELEADQLGIRYLIRAGFDPYAVLALLADFERFETPGPFLRTHPYIATRRAHLERYLRETYPRTSPPSTVTPARDEVAERLRRLRQAQRLYPVGSVSWNNLQGQIDELEEAQ